MRLIFLSWAYPPMAYPRAIQVQRLARHIRHRPLDIICLAPTGGAVLEQHESDDVVVTRLPRTLPIRIAEALLPKRANSILLDLDVRQLWWRLAARYIAALRPAPTDVLVTFGQPMVDHLAGLAVKRRTGVWWIAHFSDPWADNPFDPRAADARADEEEVLRLADRAIFTTAETVDLVMAKYPQAWRRRARVLPHGFEPNLYPRVGPNRPVITVRYVGNLFAGRGPEPLFAALALMRRQTPALVEGVRFEFVGAAPAQVSAHALIAPWDGLVAFVPKVGHREALALMMSSDLLLNIDAPAATSVFLPSKLIEYVGAARPIFGITPPGASRRLIEELGGWTADPHEPEQIAKRLAAALAFAKQHRGKSWGNEAVRQRYAAANVAAGFERMVEEMMSERPQPGKNRNE